MCTLTALVILVSGVPVPYGRDVGVELTTKAFAAVYGDFAPVFIAVSLVCFAFATVLGWGLYGARCAQFLFGTRAWKFFVAAQMAAVVAGACLQTGVVWSAAEAVNGLMVIPNLTALAILTPEVVRLTKEYQKIRRKSPRVEVVMQISINANRCEPSPMRKFHPYAVEAEKKGKKIYHLNIGQPDLPTPTAYYDAVRNFDRKTLAYAESPGMPVLIDAVRGYYHKLGVDLAPNDVLITTAAVRRC